MERADTAVTTVGEAEVDPLGEVVAGPEVRGAGGKGGSRTGTRISG